MKKIPEELLPFLRGVANTLKSIMEMKLTSIEDGAISATMYQIAACHNLVFEISVTIKPHKESFRSIMVIFKTPEYGVRAEISASVKRDAVFSML